jgi:uncharacterized membrane protein YfcA
MTALLAVMLLVGVIATLYGFVWSESIPRSIAFGVLGVLLIVCDLYMLVLAVTRQGRAWLFREDNTTTKWQIQPAPARPKPQDGGAPDRERGHDRGDY